MKNIGTIFRRDFAAYFTSPIGYIFMIVFLAISVGLFITSFFTFPVADMRGFFSNLPIMLCVFIPAVTMRVWAEDRKENTWEMLLTFPMRASELVLGKFLATLAFYALTVAATFTVPLMLMSLGSPDKGAIFGGYLGTLLIGGFFLSMGLFFSGFCKDQIVAFVVTLLACFLVFLLGTTFIASYIDGVIPGLGSMLMKVVGVIDHYSAFTRGVVEVADVIYFLGWTALFLVLNAMYIEGRNRPGVRLQFGAAIVLCAGIGLALNWLVTGTSLARFDLTEGRIYTVSDASRRVLSALDTPVQVNLYITPRAKMPTGLTTLEADITGKLEELRIAAGGKLEFNTIHLEAANVLSPSEFEEEEDETDEAKSIERRMLDKGVEPFAVRAMSGDEVTQKLIYSSIGIGYRDRSEEIIPRVMPENLQELEYRLVNLVFKVTRPEPPVVAVVAPKEAFQIDPQMRQIMMQMGQQIPEQEDPYSLLEDILRYERYDVRRVELTRESPLPEKYDVLVLINPRGLDERQRWEINRALMSGKPVVLAVQKYEWNYQVTRQGIQMTRRDENPGINELLAQYGLGVSDDVLMDANNVPLTVQTGANPLEALFGGGTPVRSPTHIVVSGDSMDTETPITSRLAMILYFWGTALDLNQDELSKHGLEARVLMRTSPRAWSVPGSASLTADMLEEPAGNTREFPLMAMVTGQFPDAFRDQPRPAWPPAQPRPGMPPMPPEEEDDEVEPASPAPSKLILLGCAQMFRKNFMQDRSSLDLFLNSVDAVTLGDDLIQVRSSKPIDRTIPPPTERQKNVWKFVNYALMSIIIAVTGIVIAFVRRHSRNAYTMAYAGRRES